MDSSPPPSQGTAPGSPDTLSNSTDSPDVVQEALVTAQSPVSGQASPETMMTPHLASSSASATPPENVRMADKPLTSPPSRPSTPSRPASPEMTVSPLSASPPSPKTPNRIPDILADPPDDPQPPPSPRPKPLKFTNHFPELPRLPHTTVAYSQDLDSSQEGQNESLGLLTSEITGTSGVPQHPGKAKIYLRPPQRNDERVEGDPRHSPKPGPGDQAPVTWSDTRPLPSSTGSSAWKPVNSPLPRKRKLSHTLEVPSSSPPPSSMSSDLVATNTRNRPLAKPCTCGASQSSVSDDKSMPTPPITPGFSLPTSSQKPAVAKVSKADALHDVSSKRRMSLEDAHLPAPYGHPETTESEQPHPAHSSDVSPAKVSRPPPPPIPEAVRCYACTMNRAVQAEIEVRNRWAPKIRGLEYWIDGMNTDDPSSSVHLALLRKYKTEDKMSYEDLRDYQIDQAWSEFNRWHGPEARRLAAAKAREQLMELCGYDNSDSDDSGSESGSGPSGKQDGSHSRRRDKEGPKGDEADEQSGSVGSGDMDVDELGDLGEGQTEDLDEEAERLSMERDQAWEDERREQREENARLRAALEKSKVDNQSLSISIRHMQMVLHAQEVKRKETVKSNPNWLKRLPEPDSLQRPSAKRGRKDIKGSSTAAKNRASSSKSGHVTKDKRDGNGETNCNDGKKRISKNGVEEPLNWDPRNQCDEAALALKQYREELAMKENERCRRMVTAATVPVVPTQGRWRKLFMAEGE